MNELIISFNENFRPKRRKTITDFNITSRRVNFETPADF